MKRKIIISAAFLFFFSCKTLAQSPPTVKSILDSLEVLKEACGLVDGYTNPPTVEETRYYNISRMLFALPFSVTKKLLEDKNKFVRVYGFTVATKRYFDSLTVSDLKIFSDTAKLPLYTQKGIIDAGITVGQYCEMAHTSTIKEQRTAAKEKDVIASIKHFIKTSTRYPESYKSIDFANYSWGGDDDDRFFEIQHRYKLKQIDGTLIEASHYFILDSTFKIRIIETVRSKTVRVNVPELDEWKNKFGKEN
jgi:hypothetical protein